MQPRDFIIAERITELENQQLQLLSTLNSIEKDCRFYENRNLDVFVQYIQLSIHAIKLPNNDIIPSAKYLYTSPTVYPNYTWEVPPAIEIDHDTIEDILETKNTEIEELIEEANTRLQKLITTHNHYLLDFITLLVHVMKADNQLLKEPAILDATIAIRNMYQMRFFKPESISYEEKAFPNSLNLTI